MRLKSIMTRRYHGEGTMETEDCYVVKESHCIEENSFINNNKLLLIV